MKRSLIFCNTNYQLIIAIQIKLSLKQNEQVTVILTDQIKNNKELQKKLLEIGLFEKVCTMEVKKRKSKLIHFRNCIFGFLPKELKGIRYDELIGYNLDLATYELYAGLYRNNKNIEINRMEEGLLSYGMYKEDAEEGISYRIVKKTRKVLHKKNLKDNIRYFYCFAPNIYQGKSEPKAIPKIKKEDKNIVDILKKVFMDRPMVNFKEKYIYLFSICEFDGKKSIGELDLALRIAHLVGKDNLIIKAHPRDDVSRFRDYGLKMIDSLVPWEILQISLDFSDKVLMTTLSGSLLNLNPILESVPKSYYLYKLCDLSGNKPAQDSSMQLERLLKNQKAGFKNIEAIETIEEIQR